MLPLGVRGNLGVIDAPVFHRRPGNAMVFILSPFYRASNTSSSHSNCAHPSLTARLFKRKNWLIFKHCLACVRLPWFLIQFGGNCFLKFKEIVIGNPAAPARSCRQQCALVTKYVPGLRAFSPNNVEAELIQFYLQQPHSQTVHKRKQSWIKTAWFRFISGQNLSILTFNLKHLVWRTWVTINRQLWQGDWSELQTGWPRGLWSSCWAEGSACNNIMTLNSQPRQHRSVWVTTRWPEPNQKSLERHGNVFHGEISTNPDTQRLWHYKRLEALKVAKCVSVKVWILMLMEFYFFSFPLQKMIWNSVFTSSLWGI